MRTKLFDFDSDPNAEVLDVSEYFIQIDLKERKRARWNKGYTIFLFSQKIWFLSSQKLSSIIKIKEMAL